MINQKNQGNVINLKTFPHIQNNRRRIIIQQKNETYYLRNILHNTPQQFTLNYDIFFRNYCFLDDENSSHVPRQKKKHEIKY